MTRKRIPALGLALVVAATGEAGAQPLTVEHAVQLALKQNTEAINAEAGVLDARSGVLSAYSGVMPSLTVDFSRSEQRITGESGKTLVGGQVFPVDQDSRSSSTAPVLSATWPVLRLSSWAGLSSARQGLRAAQSTRSAARNDIALATRRQFYEVVRAMRLADVASGALRSARDNERRVRALYEVGSVSKSDLLKAQVATAQSQFDSLNARQSIVAQRISLAVILGVAEAEMPMVDTLLTVQPQQYEEAALLAEATRSRPDLAAADAELAAARTAVSSARMLRLPYVTAGGSLEFGRRSKFTQENRITGTTTAGDDRRDQQLGGQVALSWDLFDGFLTDSRIASARARLLRAQENQSALRRNLQGEIHQALLTYDVAVQQDRVARTEVESATENLKLTQQKYNVGSATILELIDAQVQLQRAQSDQVSALASIRVAEAQINRLRGRAE